MQRKGRRRRWTLVLYYTGLACPILATASFPTAISLFQAVFVILAEKKERGSTSIYPPPWSRIYVSISWLGLFKVSCRADGRYKNLGGTSLEGIEEYYIVKLFDGYHLINFRKILRAKIQHTLCLK